MVDRSSRGRATGPDALIEFENGPKVDAVPSTATVAAADQRREAERLRSQRRRQRDADPDTHVDNKAGGQPSSAAKGPSRNPFAGLRASWAKKVGEPAGPTEVGVPRNPEALRATRTPGTEGAGMNPRAREGRFADPPAEGASFLACLWLTS